MGLDIKFYFADGKEDEIHMRYSSFSNRVMGLDDMIKWGFTDHDGHYRREALNFLVDRLVASGYLEKKYDPMPVLAIFC